VVEADNPGQVCSYRVEVVGGSRIVNLVGSNQPIGAAVLNVQIRTAGRLMKDDFWFSHEGTEEDPLLLPTR